MRRYRSDHYVIVALGIALAVPLSLPLSGKSQITKMTISGGDLLRPIEVTDESILGRLNIWSGPGNFKLEGGVKIPIVRDGSIVWSQGPGSDVPKEPPPYEVSFYGRFPEERLMYVVLYKYDPAAQKGYVYLPGRGEKWYDVNVRSIYRGVEGNWFGASEEFAEIINGLVNKTRVSPGK